MHHIWYGLFLVMSSRLQHIVTFAYGHTKIRDFPTWNTPASPLLPKTCPHVVSYHEISYSFIITTPRRFKSSTSSIFVIPTELNLDILMLRHSDNFLSLLWLLSKMLRIRASATILVSLHATFWISHTLPMLWFSHEAFALPCLASMKLTQIHSTNSKNLPCSFPFQ